MADYQLTQTGAEVQELLDIIGTDTLSTTAQTLTGAVNELVGEVGALEPDMEPKSSVTYFTSQTVSVASNAEILRITDTSITTDTVVLGCVFDDPSYISGDVTWTSYAGYISFIGTCTVATTADVTLGTKIN